MHGGTLSGLAAIALWSLLAVLTTATDGLPPFQVLATTFAIAGCAGLAWSIGQGRAGIARLRQPVAALALSTVALFGYHALYFIALKRAPAVEANLINYLWPLLIVLLAGLLPGTRVAWQQLLGAALGLFGAVALVTRGERLGLDPAHAPGYLAALGAAVTWAVYSVVNRRFAAVPSAALAGSCLLVAILGGAAHGALESFVAPSPVQWLVLLVMGLGPVGAAFVLWDHGTKHGDIALLGTLSYAAPLLSTLLLLVSGAARPHWTQAVAVALLLCGAWLGVRYARPAGEPR
ncbi:aromatic amino acid exporter YddG [Dokdonella koreensis]|uniref:Permease of the drug/metabolite transporter (DMT) superfamily n=1 Tax=Dokdonella koreensis DS-123 TaxID=1300342 RepID=A0A160DT95_9GAMM|nr:EamA family transporter [Dokdonella koreensis]ANB17404.1 Permease of the drug/metabolite transporter (DMT) superfamily [Dokdonella koreensis DS-123]